MEEVADARGVDIGRPVVGEAAQDRLGAGEEGAVAPESGAVGGPAGRKLGGRLGCVAPECEAGAVRGR